MQIHRGKRDCSETGKYLNCLDIALTTHHNIPITGFNALIHRMSLHYCHFYITIETDNYIIYMRGGLFTYKYFIKKY